MKIIFIHDTTGFKVDIIAEHVAEGLYDNGVEVIASHLGNGIKQAYSEDEILEHSKDADFIFYLWAKTGGKYGPLGVGKEGLVKKINRPEITVYIDGSEWSYTGQKVPSNVGPEGIKHRGEPWIHEEMFDYCKWYFKRECYPEDAERGIIPFSYGCVNSMFTNSTLRKKHDVFCSFFQYHTGLRSEIRDFLNGMDNIYILDNKLNWDDYIKVVLESYISVSAWGAGTWCNREWESLANKVLCFVQRPMVLCSNKPEDGIHWVEYSDINEFEEKMNYYLNNKDLCLEIGKSGYDHALKYHTSKNKISNLLDMIQ